MSSLRRAIWLATGGIFLACTLVISGFGGINPLATQSSATAADLSQFNAGNIISDDVFFNGSAMSAVVVQDFLNKQVPSCTINNGQPSHAAGAPFGSTTISDVCLKDFYQSTPNMSAQPRLCNAYAGGPSERASDIIAKVGIACNISQKVLLVLLEKEQSLVSDSWPTVRQLNQATGFACYDNGQPCVQDYAGFFYQVWAAASQFQRYGNSPYTWYPVGQVTPVLYQANMPECGSKPVLIQNRATAALYYYTPYTPNAASLAAGYARGDACSAYGNRNFFQNYVDWFGSTQSSTPPLVGGWDILAGTPGGITTSGWLLDPASQTAITSVIFTIDGIRQAVLTADTANSASLAQFPSAGSNHGFTTTFSAGAGTHRICGYPQTQTGALYDWGCTYVTVPTAPLVSGSWATLTGIPGQIGTSGWLLDPASQTAITSVVFTIDGIRQAVLTADTANSASLAQFPSAGSNHGFTTTFSAGAGTHRICGYPQTQTGALYDWGCTYVTVPTAPLVSGSWETLTGIPGQIATSGWLLTPANQSAATTVIFSVDGVLQSPVTANSANTASLTNYPSAGSNHGFTTSISASAGTHRICGY
ncbi:hypothetical protein, partial [Alpinimonas psychrophila]